MNSFCKFVFQFTVLIGSIILRGYVISLLWFWFVVGIFHINPISIPQSIGLSLLSFILTFHTTNRDDAERFDVYEYSLMLSYTVSLVALAIGYIVKSFI